ncbi:MAG: alkaline phosphatase D family protein [Opitutaceae bacterium]|nr:alkaline phosphatase D family protein [Opitutaceae bacterium]
MAHLARTAVSSASSSARPVFPLAGSGQVLPRRAFLTASLSFAAAALVSNRALGQVGRAPGFSANPFSLGVASGDPAPDGVVLWTRLAPRPLEPGGGMTPEPVEVAWQVAEDEGMGRVVAQGTATAQFAWAHSVHVEVEGLRPDRWYWYQFKVGSVVSPKGRTRTLPAAHVRPERLRFAFASCQKYETGYYTAFEHLAREDLDLVLHLGDYIYEKADGKGAVRTHGTPEIFTLDDYRARYAVYKSDPALQAAHAIAPWIVTWDDHEVSNNYAGSIPENPEATTTADFLRRRAAGYQAYYEHMPLRRSALPHGPDLLLYRRLGYGTLASFHVLDTRQYRTDQPQDDGVKPVGPVLLDPKGTIMGDRQRDWLFRGLEQSPAVWNSLAQQVMVARVDREPGPGVAVSMDKWSGYEYERRRLLAHLRDRKVNNPVVLTGDIHTHWANEIPADPDRADDPSVATEFVGTSISSSGDGEAKPRYLDSLMAENPGVKFHNSHRGYVRCEVTPTSWRADFRTVPYVSRRGAPLETPASFVVESGRPRLNRV